LEDSLKVWGRSCKLITPEVGDENRADGRRVAELYGDYITACASQFCRSYDDREELASRVVLTLLEYGRPISHPHKFIRIVTKNLALNSTRVGSGVWETVESEMAGASRGENFRSLLDASDSEPPIEQAVLLKDTLIRMEEMLSPAERRCYDMLKQGLEPKDLSVALGVSRQFVHKMLRSIRKKYVIADVHG